MKTMKRIKVYIGTNDENVIKCFLNCLITHKEKNIIDQYEVYVEAEKRYLFDNVMDKDWIKVKTRSKTMLSILIRLTYTFSVPGTKILNYDEYRADYSLKIVGNKNITLEDVIRYGVLNIPRY